MPDLPTDTVTFLFTDIEGSTVLLERLGDLRYATLLADHHRLVRVAFRERGGAEVDTQGDSFLVVFHVGIRGAPFVLVGGRSPQGAVA